MLRYSLAGLGLSFWASGFCDSVRGNFGLGEGTTNSRWVFLDLSTVLGSTCAQIKGHFGFEFYPYTALPRVCGDMMNPGTKACIIHP